MLIHEIGKRISMYISRYNVIRLRVKFTYFVTQNIIFDKTDFTKDFFMRYIFAEYISILYNVKVYNVVIEWPSHYEFIREKLIDFIHDLNLSKIILKTFHDWYSDSERKWTFTNYAKKLDTSCLSDFIVPYAESKFCCDASESFVYPEIQRVKWYLHYIKIFDGICATLEKKIDVSTGRKKNKKRNSFSSFTHSEKQFHTKPGNYWSSKAYFNHCHSNTPKNHSQKIK